MLEAVRAEAPEAAVVVASAPARCTGRPSALPVDEDAPLRPQNPYAVSKASADLLAGFYADAHGLRVVRARAFNHAGPGQEPIYAIASFARQVAAGSRPARTRSGSSPATPTRAATSPTCATSCAPTGCSPARGEPGVYNVCSGAPRRPRELIAALGRGRGRRGRPRGRPEAAARARGDGGPRLHERLHGATGWEPEIPLEQTLADTVAWWREEIRAGRAGARVHE